LVKKKKKKKRRRRRRDLKRGLGGRGRELERG
jgi:hypothetical protein